MCDDLLRKVDRFEDDVVQRRELERRDRDLVVFPGVSVRPMHMQFVESSKRYADLIVPEGYNVGVVGTITSLIRDFLATR